MSAAIVSGKSEKDFQLLVSIAEKMGLSITLVSDDDLETLNKAKSKKENEASEVAELV
ncbi:hypothetical protein JN11_02642 [Mucilaginibacter frigoritolerans]|jgi:hypothetical protein|uniref:Uncharacterized protein n=1 Tax=Mucilaginibacter frigoritolerans TaxID=652788 RepID=A0A562U0G9_9SPHI|nr:hypothetical protein [Mucilaginibacter frigoritolerans]TWI99325.1 hypothetical protein JN11_02642 [Mucilaginibacter frigoritolerans]